MSSSARCGFATIVLASLAVATATPAQAATFNVGAGDTAALIADINVANGNGQPNTIVLTPSTYVLSAVDNYWYGPNGLPAIASNLTIEGNGAAIQRDATAPNFRLFFIGADPARAQTLNYTSPGAGSLTLHNLTLTGGLAKGGNGDGSGGGAGMGGAIFNQGVLLLDAVTVNGNTAQGGVGTYTGTATGGGGIGTDGSGSLGGGFGPGTFGGAAGGTGSNQGGGGGGGGFLATETGGNATGFGGFGGGPNTGLGGNGLSNLAGDGSGGGGNGDPNADPGGAFAAGGTGAGGGGVGGGGGFFAGGSGGGGGFGAGGGGALCGSGGFGGGESGVGLICGRENPGFGGGTGATYDINVNVTVDGGAGAGMGGAVFNMQGSIAITNATFYGNTAAGGVATAKGGAGSGQGLGGAVFNLNGAVTVTNATITGNTASDGGGGLYNLNYDSITARNPVLTVKDSIVANDAGNGEVVNNGPDSTTAGANMGMATTQFQDSDAVGLVTGMGHSSITFDTPKLDPNGLNLQPAANNGGPTLTMLPGSGSNVIDAGACPLTVDERGQTRPDPTGETSCDIGAVETQPPATTTTAADASASFSTSAQTVTLSATVTSTAGTVSEGSVTFTVAGLGPSVSANVTNGAASASFTVPANSPVGSYAITAAYTGTANFAPSTDLTRSLTVGPGQATHFVVSAPSVWQAGTSNTFTVTALDAGNNTATGYNGTVHFTTTDGHSTLPADATLANGTGTFSATLKTAGSQTITATDTTNNSIAGTSNPIQVRPGPATAFVVSAPSSATVGAQFGFTVTAIDSFGNATPAFRGTLHFTSTDGNATLPADTALPAGGGTFNATLRTVGGQTITASATPVIPVRAQGLPQITGTSNTINVGAAPLPTIAISSPTTGAAYELGQYVTATYSCADPAGIASCNGTVASGAAIDTSHAGAQFTFTVTATGSDGQTVTKSMPYSVLEASTELHGTPFAVLGASPDRARTALPTARAMGTLTNVNTHQGVAGKQLRFATVSGQTLCIATTNTAGVATCRVSLTTSLDLALRRGYKLSFTGDPNYLSSSAVISATRHDPRLRLRSLAAMPGAPGCEGELNGHGTRGSGPPAPDAACFQLNFTINGTLAPGSGGRLTITMRRGTRRIVTLLDAGARWGGTMIVPGRGHEPGDRWTITIAYSGDGTHGAATIARQVQLEAESGEDQLNR